MAGFFLYKTSDNRIHLSEALDAFSEKGLIHPGKYVMGDYTLYIYPKMTEELPAVVETEQGLCAVVGAYVYKGLNKTESLKKTLADYLSDKLSLSDMYGQYTLILYHSQEIHIVSDALSSKHFFSDRSFSFFSSSLFSAASAIGKYTINDQAVYEKLLTGIIISPDTIIQEIVQMNRLEQEKANEMQLGVSFILHPDITIKPFHTGGAYESEKIQSECILNYFNKLKSTIEEDRVDLGLSAGHDSSLLFAALVQKYQEQLHLHTHSTGHVHDREKSAAEKMAAAKGMNITVIPTPRLDEEGIDLSRLLYENLAFFDGRTSHDIGGFSATYRAQYRINATDGCHVTFSGVGGECYRNHYSERGRKINADQFFMDKIYNKSFIEGASQSIIERTRQAHIRKAEAIIKVPLHGKVNRINLRRYYSEIMMADGQGHVIDAYNLVSSCFAPFLEQRILSEAYCGLNYLQNNGEYESAIIGITDPVVGGCINANNGYPFNHIPLKLRIKENLRTRVSKSIWERMNAFLKSSSSENGEKYLKTILSKSGMLSEAFTDMQKLYSDIDFDQVIKGYAMDANVAYLALTMRKLNHE